MERYLLLVFSVLILVIASLNSFYFSATGFWLLFALFVLIFVSFDFFKRFLAFALLMFFSAAMVIASVAILRFGADLLSFGMVLLGVVGNFLLIASVRPSRPAIRKEELQERSKILDKEIPKEEKPRVVITDAEERRYIASKKGKALHIPSCPIAKRISSDNIIWFSSKNKAWSKGYKSHSCIKE